MNTRAAIPVLALTGSLVACDVGGILDVLLPATGNVSLYANSLSPITISIRQGGTITWRNYASVAHRITPNSPAQAGVWTSRIIPAQEGATFSHTFTTAGTFNYFCMIHNGMTGTVRVE